ncbi:MAG: hypothetical protein ACOZCO_04470 [Bacteroidota bacterium]
MKPVLKQILFLLTGAIFLLIPAFDNNFPFVYPDTGAYIASGFNGDVPVDRPISYGLFLRHISLKTTLWLPVFLQSIIVFYLIYLCVKYFVRSEHTKVISLIVTLILVSCTGLGYHTGQLMPDIFTGILAVTLILLVFSKHLSFTEKILLFLILLVSSLMHVSNILFMLILSFILIVYFCVRYKFSKNILTEILKYRLIFLTTITALLLLPSIHYIYGKQFVLTRNSHVFLTAKFCESGLLEKYLKDNCKEKAYKLCEFKDNLPKSAMEFIWSPESPFYKTGVWEKSETEYKEINSGIIFTPKYWKWLFTDAVKSTLSQYFTFTAGGGLIPLPEGSPTYFEINSKMHHELNQYVISKQSKNYLDTSNINRRQYMLFILSLLVFSIILFIESSPINTIVGKKMVVFVLLMPLINAFICGFFANVYERLQARVVWILPLFLLIILTNYFLLKYKTKA